MQRDRTNKEEYTYHFDCSDYSKEIISNAFDLGIRGYYVRIEWSEPPGHAIVAFNTTDRGLVFFESQTDKEMDVAIGIRYWRDNVRRSRPGYDDTIIQYELVG